MSNVAIPETAPSYLAALIAACPELALINQDALAGSSKPMPPHIVADKGRFIKKADGVEEVIMFPDNDQNRAAGIVGMPVPRLQAVILKGKPGKEKAYYVNKYTPGQEATSPDCSSDDGIKPNADSRLKQCESCAACPQNVFGSGTNADGTPSGGKACSDRKVVAIYAAGSAYRFAVPPASLKSWDSYCNQLTTKGLPLPAVITTIGFEVGDASYKLTFEFGGMLAEKQLEAVVKMLDTPEVKEIVAPRNAQAALPAPAAQGQIAQAQNAQSPVDLDAERAKRAAEADKVAAAEAEKKAKAEKAAAAKKAKEDKAKADAAAAAQQTAGGLDLGLDSTPTVSSTPVDVAPTDDVSDDDLIASLGLD